MDKFVVTYLVNNTTVTDVLVGTGASYQRFDQNLHITFHGGDGRYLENFSKPVRGEHDPMASVSYARCEKMTRHWVQDISTEVS